MIKANAIQTIVYELQIDEHTAIRLKAMMQNPHPNEPPDIARIREEFWNALNAAGVKI